ncbi:hypothetical protein ZIOFF_002092 [Zingiber officinale]|uniref:UspA domain-containing protein n=1 Tax=Zingiber officinale TaxID=94328 RepID=A0A8J5LSN5_ZINOF|nr:hypothetical protein ZIOFF_002092 [Zingiber officinale]
MESQKVVVVMEEAGAARSTLQWAINKFIRGGDYITLLYVYPSTRSRKKQRNYRLKGFQLALSFKDLCNGIAEVVYQSPKPHFLSSLCPSKYSSENPRGESSNLHANVGLSPLPLQRLVWHIKAAKQIEIVLSKPPALGFIKPSEYSNTIANGVAVIKQNNLQLQLLTQIAESIQEIRDDLKGIINYQRKKEGTPTLPEELITKLSNLSLGSGERPKESKGKLLIFKDPLKILQQEQEKVRNVNQDQGNPRSTHYTPGGGSNTGVQAQLKTSLQLTISVPTNEAKNNGRSGNATDTGATNKSPRTIEDVHEGKGSNSSS